MKDPGFDLSKVQIIPAPKSIGAPIMEKSSTPSGLFRHHVRVGGWGLFCATQMARVDFVCSTVGQYDLAQRVFPNKPSPEEWEGGSQPRQVDEHIKRGPTCPLSFATDIRELFRLGIDINHFHLVDDPVPAS